MKENILQKSMKNIFGKVIYWTTILNLVLISITF